MPSQPPGLPGSPRTLVDGDKVRGIIRRPVVPNGANDWGTAGMGGNGQFKGLSALDDLTDETGPPAGAFDATRLWL